LCFHPCKPLSEVGRVLDYDVSLLALKASCSFIIRINGNRIRDLSDLRSQPC
jgi:hypothetical protein